MGIGITSNNVVPLQGSSWEDLLGIDVDDCTNITRANFFVQIKGNDLYWWVEALYIGSGALTTSQLQDFPKGSIIHAVGLATPAIYYKVAVAGTNTWKYNAINS
jgi:hypothetical protein